MCSQFFEDTEDGGGEALMSPSLRPKTTSLTGSASASGVGSGSMSMMMDGKHRSISGSASPMMTPSSHYHLTQSPGRAVTSSSNISSNNNNNMVGTPSNQKNRRTQQLLSPLPQPQSQLLSPVPQPQSQQQLQQSNHNLSTPLPASSLPASSSTSFPELFDTTIPTANSLSLGSPIPTTMTLTSSSTTPLNKSTTPFSKSKPRTRHVPTVISTGTRDSHKSITALPP